MNKLKEQLRFKMLGQLSNERTREDIDNAYNVAVDFAVSFSVFCAENCYYKGNNRWNKNFNPKDITTEEILNKFLEEYGK